ncbi:L-xylulose 5-phosphate 3-epimerase [Bacillus sp. J14TS2]|uniref:L-ribulose-5-phosphate 3-epimerase n=1 Tax=Bacillus sp. J14TS2 TaxID=2807188 RepID=UPI001B1D596A|nr:L-ribulose-5-phosphate 3-epimerase [Bacillus sp. J14TS2]GIN69528.1 L-xylulose 5-phosphate 3-epimerase [Bacillus sp. J14TS2]
MNPLGIYEKALPANISWLERLELAKELNFDYVEMSIDETDKRLARLDWTQEERKAVIDGVLKTGIKIPSICLSGHRRFPLGSTNEQVRKQALEVMQKAINLASDIGVRVIQLAGYDVYYEEKSIQTRHYYIEGMKKCLELAAEKQITLAIEIMDDPFINSVTEYYKVKKQLPSPWLKVYPDLGNLSAWIENDVGYELEIGMPQIVGVHLKDTLAVANGFPGKFKEVPFGEGCVDFEGCLKILKANHYSGPFLIEMWSEKSDRPEEEIKQALSFLLPKFKEAGYDYKR